jgi:hypothetical protein
MIQEEAVRRSSVIPKEKQESLISDLRRIPDFSWLVGAPNPHVEKLQGDFLASFPVCYINSKLEPAVARKSVMIINNTCDLPDGRGSFVSVAPVIDFKKYIESQAGKRTTESLRNHEADLRKNQISELFFIPQITGFADGAIVMLNKICSVPASFLNEAVSNGARIGSFTQNGFYVLLIKLTHHLTRRESEDVSRN